MSPSRRIGKMWQSFFFFFFADIEIAEFVMYGKVDVCGEHTYKGGQTRLDKLMVQIISVNRSVIFKQSLPPIL